MKEYDVIVIGSGEGGKGIAFKSAENGLKTALIEKGIFRGYIGGTCLTVGCVPTKALIVTADMVMEAERARRLGIQLEIKKIDFREIMERMRASRQKVMDYLSGEFRKTPNLDFYTAEAHFTGEYTLDVDGEGLRGEKIIIATGARPAIPPVKGLADIEYLTNETALELTEKPKSMIILGGGYIAVEFAHFFAAMGTKVTIVEIADRLIGYTEPEISETLRNELSRRMEILLDTEAAEFRRKGKRYGLKVKDKRSGKESEIQVEKVLVAAGRISNADLLKPENTGVKIDEKKFIKIDDYLRTRKENIWAIGDATGRQMFTHAADKEAEVLWRNLNGENVKMNFEAVPNAVFTYPQIASVGLTEAQAQKEHEILVGKAMYSHTARGKAMLEETGFAKCIAEKATRKILGFHIIGPEASTLIQEVVNVFAEGGTADDILDKMHVFPAMPDIITETLSRLEPVPAPALVSY